MRKPSHGNFQDIEGQSFGELLVVNYGGKSGRYSAWLCRCSCKKVIRVRVDSLRSGHTRSCGCLKQKRKIVHGHGRRGRRSPELSAWQGMLSRCRNPKNVAYADYGGRGITVCRRWEKSFKNFLADMGTRPSKNHTLERTNTEAGYTKSNCCWATRKEQARNRRNNRWCTWDGRTLLLVDWARELKIPYNTLRWRLDHGWPVKKAFTHSTRS